MAGAAAAIAELEQVLRSKPEKITREEINVLLGCQAKVFRTSTAGALFGSAAVWADTLSQDEVVERKNRHLPRTARVLLFEMNAPKHFWANAVSTACFLINHTPSSILKSTRRLSTLFRVNLAAGVAAYIALWGSAKSLISCTDHILGLDGTRMQKELANIMIRTSKGESWRWRLLSKHFFSETVYEDSNPDDPVLRLRTRGFFIDSAYHEKRTDDSESPNNHPDDSLGGSKNTLRNDSNEKKYNLEPKQVPVNSSAGLMIDPFDCVFGYTTTEEIHHPSASGTTGKVVSRNHKRSHRRRRMRHQEASSDAQYM